MMRNKHLTYHNLNLQFLLAYLGLDGVDQSEALAILHVQVSHGSELFLHKTKSTQLCHHEQ